MAQIELTRRLKLLVGVVHIVQLVDKPRIAQHIRVLNGHSLVILKRHDKIFRIEHVEHREDAIAFNFGHVAASLCQRRHELLHFRRNIVVNQILIATQLGSMITANALVIVARFVFVECVRS